MVQASLFQRLRFKNELSEFQKVNPAQISFFKFERSRRVGKRVDGRKLVQ